MVGMKAVGDDYPRGWPSIFEQHSITHRNEYVAILLSIIISY